MIRGALSAALLAVAAAGTVTTAADLAPDAGKIAAASAEGRALFARGGGYPLQDYTVYAVRDARDLKPADGSVDAVIIATPLERVRHGAYVGVYSGHPLSPADAHAAAKLAAGAISFIVFAHGTDGADRSFPDRFGAAVLVVKGRRFSAGAAEPSIVSESTYPLAGEDRERFVATITYRFDLASLAHGEIGEQARLQFVDASGKSFDLPVNLSTYR